MVETNPLMGQYHNCNPNTDQSSDAPGIFNCDSMDFGEGHCKCEGKDEVQTSYDMYDDDCMNGTIFKSIHVGMAGNGTNESACETACTAAADCAVFTINPSGAVDGMCHLLKEPLIQWDGGAASSACRCGIRQQGSLDVPSDNCACYKFNHLAMGFQYQGSASTTGPSPIPGMPCPQFNSPKQCGQADGCAWVPAAAGTGAPHSMPRDWNSVCWNCEA